MLTSVILRKIDQLEQELQELKKLIGFYDERKGRINKTYISLRKNINKTFSDEKAIKFVNEERERMYTS
ncbi:hypothetical protein CO051_03705 [Candidatus Roizmanbacteria bacterium CG_4_9_14_0_2_um_filter_39_13]|uniref:Uncharacterized protein n=1 Tax=Candidatus Roizmanbacteria bacterium CG_4_9_14_0_2_um_filter_39_13 TaxID=1974839 RepID=A0A2M8EYX2_9BACT|nr:MAG: hypothetical protein CO051_03705 [Candidatus Roizmanbacteria bacterium CG_4_9_14_0_2_um_filter_39_13]